MGYKDNLIRKKNGSYVLKHKTKKYKEGDCHECGDNRDYIERQLTFYSHTKSITPIWCGTCQSLKEYKSVIDDKKRN